MEDIYNQFLVECDKILTNENLVSNKEMMKQLDIKHDEYYLKLDKLYIDKLDEIHSLDPYTDQLKYILTVYDDAIWKMHTTCFHQKNNGSDLENYILLKQEIERYEKMKFKLENHSSTLSIAKEKHRIAGLLNEKRNSIVQKFTRF